MYKVTFKKNEVACLEFVDRPNGFLLLEIVGQEQIVNAIFAYLANKKNRDNAYASDVNIHVGDKKIGVSAGKEWGYRRFTKRLDNGLVDMILVHQKATIIEAAQEEFYLIVDSTKEFPPANFISHLNGILSIPTYNEWADWLWEEGLTPQEFQYLRSTTNWKGEVSKFLGTESLTPIQVIKGIGHLDIYHIQCGGVYHFAWRHLIRNHLGFGVTLKKMKNGTYKSDCGTYEIKNAGRELGFYMHGELLETDPANPNILAAFIRQTHGYPVFIEKEKGG